MSAAGGSPEGQLGAARPRSHLLFALLIRLKLNTLRQVLEIQGFSLNFGPKFCLCGEPFPSKKAARCAQRLSVQAVPAGGAAAGGCHRCRAELLQAWGVVGDSIFSPLPFLQMTPTLAAPSWVLGRSDPHHRGVRCAYTRGSFVSHDRAWSTEPARRGAVPRHCWACWASPLRHLASARKNPGEAGQWTAGQVRRRGSLETSVSASRKDALWDQRVPGERCALRRLLVRRPCCRPDRARGAERVVSGSLSRPLGPAAAAFF